MPKKPMTTLLPLPQLAQSPTRVGEPEPDTRAVAEEPATVVTQHSTGAAKFRLARLVPVKGYPIRHFSGGIVFYPGVPSAEIPVDAWIENQIRRGTLVEV